MGRGGRKTDRTDPERRCIATGASQPAAGMIRFVVGPDGAVVPDILGRLPGRGIWVAADRAALARAVDKRLFARAARQPVAVPEGLSATVEALLRARVIELVSLARKAGAAVAGYEKVRDWLVKGDAAVLVQAADGSERGKAKLRPPEGEGTFVDVLTGAELGLAFGREHVIHAALAAGGLASRVVEEAARLGGMRGRIGADGAGKD
jgi:hypothetical protein